MTQNMHKFLVIAVTLNSVFFIFILYYEFRLFAIDIFGLDQPKSFVLVSASTVMESIKEM